MTVCVAPFRLISIWWRCSLKAGGLNLEPQLHMCACVRARVCACARAHADLVWSKSVNQTCHLNMQREKAEISQQSAQPR